MIWWGEYDQGYFAFILALKISFFLLHHANSTRFSICPKQVACFLDLLDEYVYIATSYILWPLITKDIKHLSQRENSMSMIRFW